MKLEGRVLLSMLEHFAEPFAGDSYLWGPALSPAARQRRFRTQWNAVLTALRVDSTDAGGFVPASIGAGGITWLYEQTNDLPLIRWIGRWDDERTMNHYIQEAPAALAAARLPSSVRARVSRLAAQLPAALASRALSGQQ